MSPASPNQPTKVVRIIARLNVGGPAQHVVLLSQGLPSDEFETTLICGRVPETEGDMSYYAAEHGVQPVVLETMSREVSLLDDLAALRELTRLLRRLKPDIVHTHTAKAGFVGRVAARLARVPVIIHTYHGHVLSGYFGRRKEMVFRALERLCARWTTLALAVGEGVRDDLVAQRVVRPERIRVMPLGLDLQRFAEGPTGVLRAELGLSADTPLIGYCGRLVPIKNLPLLLGAMARVHAELPAAHLALIGDGELRAALEDEAARLGLTKVVHFMGWRRDTDQLFRDLNVMALSSRNEGTPVALIEAGAAGVPSVSTQVGGVARVVREGVTGHLVPPDDEVALAEALLQLLRNTDHAQSLGRQAQERMLTEFGMQRLVDDMAALYRELGRR